MSRKAFPDVRSRLFVGVYPAGIVYADMAQEENGDYKSVAFLPYRELKLEVHNPRSPLLPIVREDAAAIIARRGELFALSTCGQQDLAAGVASGQTVLLGGPLPSGLCAEFREWLSEVGKPTGKTAERVYALWLKYAEDCRSGDQSPVQFEFCEWYKADLTPEASSAPAR